PIVSTVTIPGPLPQAQPGGAFDDSGLGHYSTLITPKAGSLLHAAFQAERPASKVPIVKNHRTQKPAF
ncbi:MAG TPA: hypothetical protein VMH05_05615, partial [Bryobacteraceae bacterium]|nr:hypothetical protein [Bryobacteraceae bacterium]